MDFVQIAFFVFAAAAVGSAIGVISVRNPVHAALFLVLTFFSIACTWIVAGAEFLCLGWKAQKSVDFALPEQVNSFYVARNPIDVLKRIEADMARHRTHENVRI